MSTHFKVGDRVMLVWHCYLACDPWIGEKAGIVIEESCTSSVREQMPRVQIDGIVHPKWTRESQGMRLADQRDTPDREIMGQATRGAVTQAEMHAPASPDLVLRLCREAVADLPVVVDHDRAPAVWSEYDDPAGPDEVGLVVTLPNGRREAWVFEACDLASLTALTAEVASWAKQTRAEAADARIAPNDCPVCPVALGGVCSRCSDGEPLTEAKPATARPQPTEEPTIQSGVMVVPQRFDTGSSCIGWAEGMERHLGKPGAVDAIQCHHGVMVALVHNWWWPLSALRLASESPKALPPGYTFEAQDGHCDVDYQGQPLFDHITEGDKPEHYGNGPAHREAFAWAQALLRDGPPAGYLFRVMSSTEVQVTREMTGDNRAWYCLYRDKPELRPVWLTQSEHQAALGWALRLMGAT